MTVGQLIGVLSGLDHEMPVMVASGEHALSSDCYDYPARSVVVRKLGHVVITDDYIDYNGTLAYTESKEAPFD